MPIRVAVVEDDPKAASTLESHLERYGQENALQFRVKTYSNPLQFLEPYSADYDLVYMDIQMPMMNGMDAAHALRDIDPKVALVFVTNLTQYAIEGYQVNAMDYILKPVNYYDFALKLTRILERIPGHEGEDILVPTEIGNVRIRIDSIHYVEVQGHHLIYHTARGEYTQYSSMNRVEPMLTEHGFAKCNNCYLVNLGFVEGIRGYTVTVAGEELKISQPRKKQFQKSFEEYLKR
ncbi:MAG: response regulator transcription factor [Clostridia bacterium]|nr:response regulator transcription factor [Clostridia bacterium]MBR2287451.1 response regulator transcription factor [Clostridia bacterium]